MFMDVFISSDVRSNILSVLTSGSDLRIRYSIGFISLFPSYFLLARFFITRRCIKTFHYSEYQWEHGVRKEKKKRDVKRSLIWRDMLKRKEELLLHHSKADVRDLENYCCGWNDSNNRHQWKKWNYSRSSDMADLKRLCREQEP